MHVFHDVTYFMILLTCNESMSALSIVRVFAINDSCKNKCARFLFCISLLHVLHHDTYLCAKICVESVTYKVTYKYMHNRK